MPPNPIVLNARKLLAVVITGLVTGLVGWGLATYFERARPSLIVTSIGFRGPIENQPIEVPENLITLSTRSFVVESLSRFEQFNKLMKVEQDASEMIQLLNQTIQSVELWNKQNGVSPNQKFDLADYWPVGTVKEHPLVREEIAGNTITAHIRAEDLPAAPAASSDLKSPSLFPVFIGGEKQDRLIIYMGLRSMAIPIRNMPERVTDKLNLFANSVAHGSKLNLTFYSEQFIQQARSDILELQQVREQLRELLLPKASISAKLVIENRGKSSATFRPYFALKIDHPDFSDKTYLMTVDGEAGEGGKSPFTLTSGGFEIAIPKGEVEGKKVLVKSFLPEGSPSSYVNVPGGSVITVSLVGMDPLGSDAENIKKIYETKLLSAYVFGYAADRSEFKSELAEFSQSLGQAERDKIFSHRMH